jgi:protein SCO1/2
MGVVIASGPATRRRTLVWAVLVGLVLAFLAAGCGGSPEKVSSLAAPDASGLRGVRPDAPYPRPSFTLTDTDGNTFDFAARTAGRPTILFFGYTNCPDECPTAMADVASALRKAPEVRKGVSVVFVTTDPKRDTLSVMRRWLNRFDGSFIGLTGTPAQLTAAQQSAHIPPSHDKPTAGGGYDVAHSSLLLGYGADDRARVVYPPGSKVSDIASDLHLLAEKDPPT